MCKTLAINLFAGAALVSAVTMTEAATAECAEASGPHGSSVSAILDSKGKHLGHGRLMVLGTAHLAQTFDAETFDSSWMDGLIDVLAAFGPDKIGIEVLPPRDLHAVAETGIFRNFAEPAKPWRDIADRYLERFEAPASSVRVETGLDWAEARTVQHELFMKASEDDLTHAERRKLIATSLVAYDLYTAILNWDALPDQAQIADDGLTETAIQHLDQSLERHGEVIEIAVRLGNRLGLYRLDPIDDQIGQSVQTLAEFQKIDSTLSDSGMREELRETFESERAEAMAAVKENGDLLPLYRYMNADGYGELDIHTQWGTFVDERMDAALGQARIARREVRDLSISANIREVHARRPDADMLVIIGGSHKAFVESYLRDMTTLDIVQLEDMIHCLEQQKTTSDQ